LHTILIWHGVEKLLLLLAKCDAKVLATILKNNKKYIITFHTTITEAEMMIKVKKRIIVKGAR